VGSGCGRVSQQPARLPRLAIVNPIARTEEMSRLATYRSFFEELARLGYEDRLIQFCEVLGVPTSQVLDGLSTARRPKADPLQPLRTERGVRLAKAWDRLHPKKQAVMLNLIEETAAESLGALRAQRNVTAAR
jgi:hypothetical protein